MQQCEYASAGQCGAVPEMHMITGRLARGAALIFRCPYLLYGLWAESVQRENYYRSEWHEATRSTFTGPKVFASLAYYHTSVVAAGENKKRLSYVMTREPGPDSVPGSQVHDKRARSCCSISHCGSWISTLLYASWCNAPPQSVGILDVK